MFVVNKMFHTHKITEISVPDCGTSNITMTTNILVHKQWYPRQENIIILVIKKGRKKNVLFNDALNTFYLYGVSHMVHDHVDS